MALLSTFPLDARTYEFEWLRRAFEVGRQEGVDAAGDFKVTDGAGADLKVDVAAGLALVKGDTGFRNGLYLQVNDAAIANAATFDAAHATLPRIDQVILRMADSDDLGSAGDVPTLEKLSGVATAGATLDNRNGAAALPNDCLRLADVLVPAAAASLLAANIRDRRPWARGAFWQGKRPGASGDITGSLPLTAIDTTNLQARVECSGAPLKVTLDARARHTVAGSSMGSGVLIDGANPGYDNGGRIGYVDAAVVNSQLPISGVITLTPAAGSHLIAFGAFTNVNTMTIRNNNVDDAPPRMILEELVRQNANNN